MPTDFKTSGPDLHSPEADAPGLGLPRQDLHEFRLAAPAFVRHPASSTCERSSLQSKGGGSLFPKNRAAD